MRSLRKYLHDYSIAAPESLTETPSGIIDSAPGKDLLKDISGGSLSAFEKFYELRKRWSDGYSYIHVEFTTYGIFDDLNIDWNTKVRFLPVMMKIAQEEAPAYFSIALSLLSDLIPDDRILSRPDGFGENLLDLKKRAERYSFLPAVVDTWETLVTKARCLRPSKPDSSWKSPREMLIAEDAYLAFYPVPLCNLGDGAEEQCPVDHERIATKGRKMIDADGCRFECSAIVESYKLWLFRCHRTNPELEFVSPNYIFVRLAEDGHTTVGHWTHYETPNSPSELHKGILNLAYSPPEYDD